MKARRTNTRTNNRSNPPPSGPGAVLRGWYADKAPLLLFGLKFGALTALFYLVLLIPALQKMVAALTVGEARLAGALLNLIGQHNQVAGSTLSAGVRSVIEVVPGCSGVDFLSFFTAAVLVFPVSLAKKCAGVLIGLPLLLTLNLLRIMSLFFIGLHYPGIFDVVHEQVWALLLIATTIILYITWMKWAGPANLRTADAAA